jgi:hypothetical protein
MLAKTSQQDLVVYFNRAVDLYKGLPSFDWLAAAGIVPSLTATYTRAQIEAALGAHFSGGININCNGNTFNELWWDTNSGRVLTAGTTTERKEVSPRATLSLLPLSVPAPLALRTHDQVTPAHAPALVSASCRNMSTLPPRQPRLLPGPLLRLRPRPAAGLLRPQASEGTFIPRTQTARSSRRAV